MIKVIEILVLILFGILSLYLIRKISILEKHVDRIYKDLDEVCEKTDCGIYKY